MRGLRLIQSNKIAQKHYKNYGFMYHDGSDKRYMGMLRKTKVLCSCWMCCNPRKMYGNGKNGKTIKERKLDGNYE
jgi:hypothetical protein